MSDEKPEKKILVDLFVHDLPTAPSRSREQMVRELQTRAERFYKEASLEEISQFTGMVEAIREARGMAPAARISQIHPSRIVRRSACVSIKDSRIARAKRRRI